MHLPGLSRDELPQYLAHLLRLAGTELPLFELAAIEAIARATQSLPRKVNLLAHHALLAGAIAKAKTITVDHVQTALQETAYRRQRYTTVMVRVSKRFVDGTLWSEYLELDRVLRETLDRATDRVLSQAFQQDVADAEVRDEPGALGPQPVDRSV